MNKTVEIYLPASDPDNFKYGHIPATPAVTGHGVCNVTFEKEVWYNREWRKQTLTQIEPILGDRNILVGFSKSGLGALNIAFEHPRMFHAVIMFDVPLMHDELPPWNTSPFYDQSTWEEDLPKKHISEIASMSQDTRIIHIGGAAFHQDHMQFNALLQTHDIRSHFLSRSHLAHSWESGWLTNAFELAV